MTFQIKPLSNNIGAEVIGLNLRNALDEDMVDRVNTEWLAHNILLFRGQKLTRPQQIKFARWFGDLTLTDATTTHPKYPRVLTYDLAGHGDSAIPSQSPDLQLFSAQLCELLNEVGVDSAALVGFSLGGMINRKFALKFPGRVKALGIFNSPHERDSEAQRLVEQRAEDSAKSGPESAIEATIERWFTPSFRNSKPDIIDKVRGWVLANDPEFYGKCRQVLASGVQELIRPCPPINVPTLVITGENDSGSTPDMSISIANEIDVASVLIIPHLKHMGLLEAPELFTQPLCHFLGHSLLST